MKYEEMLKKHHKKNIKKLALKLYNKAPSVINSMRSRSKKEGVKFNLSKEDIHQMIYEKYMTPCRYDNTRLLNHNNMVFDHIVPVSKGGESTRKNIQIISKFSNNLKGSLTEEQLDKLLTWLDTLDDDMRKNIRTRLTKGIY